jgi:hypothetical protein
MKNGKMRDSLILYEVQVPMARLSGKIFRDPEIYILIVSYRVIQDSGTKNRRWHAVSLFRILSVSIRWSTICVQFCAQT